jgi:hypothetical protein
MLESEAVRHSYGKKYHLLENDDIFHYHDVVNTAADYISQSQNAPFGRPSLGIGSIAITKDIHGEILFAAEVRVNHDGWLSLVTCIG